MSEDACSVDSERGRQLTNDHRRPKASPVTSSDILGLWLPDASGPLRLDPRYAVRFANRDVPWWTNDEGEYGANVLEPVRLTQSD